MDAIQHLVDHRNDEWRLEFGTSNHVVALTGDHTVLIDPETA